MRRARSALIGVLIALAICTTVKANVVPPVAENVATPGASDQAANNIGKTAEGFAAGVWLSEKKEALKNWTAATPTEMIPVTSSVERNVPAYLAVFFTGQAKDTKGKCEVYYDLIVHQPDGAKLVELHDANGCGDKTRDSKRIHIGEKLLEISLPMDASAGQYSIEATVSDRLSKSTLELKSNFTVFTYSPLPTYDFATDYRATLEEETRKNNLQALEEIANQKESTTGITLKQYAQVSAHFSNGEDLTSILKKKQIDSKSWDKASANWQEKMAQQDDTFQVSMAYSYCFYAAGVGKYPKLGEQVAEALLQNSKPQGEPPIDKDTWIAIKKDITEGLQKGEQYEKITARHDFNVYDWSVIDAWWSRNAY